MKFRHFSKLSLKMILGAIAFGLLLTMILTHLGYRHFRNVFRSQYEKFTSQFAYISLSYIQGSSLYVYNESDTKDSYYELVNSKLNEITNIADLESISVSVPDPISCDFHEYIYNTVNARYGGIKEPHFLGEKESFKGRKREFVINVKRLMQLGRTFSEYTIGKNSSGKYTGTITTYIPVRDEYNNIPGMLFIEKSIDEMLIVQALYFKKITIAATIIFLVFIFIYGLSLYYSIIKPIRLITDETSYFAKNNKLSGLLEKVKNTDEIGSLSRAIKNMSNDINHYITELTSVTAEKERISTELNVAKKIQSDMLPQIYPAFPDREDFDLYAKMEPAKEVGGDLYDYLMLDNDHIMLVVGDVSGKGVPAALFMVIAKTLLSSHAVQKLSPKEIFETTNNQLCTGNESSLFVTCWLGIITLSTGELRYVNAGHPFPILFHDGKFSFESQKPNLVLGAMEDLSYTEHSLKLQKGDRLFVYTDGVTEATDLNDKLFGDKRLLEAMENTRDKTAPEVLNSIRASIDSFVGKAEQFDDITMLEFILK
ncbi:MAG: SpoIIE family protein phosphatase [Treponema sp.]|nr:SpoIIE family protein phosphatase [Treponema sp.]